MESTPETPERLDAASVARAMTTCNACDTHPARPGCAAGLCIPCELAARGAPGYAIPIGGGWATVCASCASEAMLDDDDQWDAYASAEPLALGAAFICEVCDAEHGG